MRKIGAIAAVTLLRLARDRVALFFAFVLPFLIIVLIGAASPGRDMPVGLVVDGDGPLAREVETGIRDADGLAVRDYSSLEGLRRAVRRREVVGGLLIPRGYDADVEAGRTASVTFVSDRSNTDSMAVQTRVSEVVAAQSAVLQAARAVVDSAGGDIPDRLVRVRELAEMNSGVDVEVSTAGDDPLHDVTVFDYATYGELLLFMFLTALTGAGDIVERQRLGVTRRMLSTPTTSTTAILGDSAGHLSVAGIQAFMVVVLGAAVFGVRWGDPIATAALVALFALVSTGAGLLVGTLARTNEQASSIGPPAGIALAMLGGCMWPLEIVPDTMRAVAHLTPHAWAMDAFVDLAGRGAGIGAIGTELAALAAFAVALLALGSWRLRRAVTG